MIQRSQGLLYHRLRWITASPVVSAIKDAPPGAPVPPILPPQDGFLFLDKAKFPSSFAADVDAEKQCSWLTLKSRGVSSTPVVRSVRRHGGSSRVVFWIVTEDKMIPPPAQHFRPSARFDSRRVAGSHATMFAANAVATLIENASKE